MSALHPFKAEADAQSSLISESTAEAAKSTEEGAVQIVCRLALVKGPGASLSALTTHRASIDPALVKLLEIVGDYKLERGRTSLHASVINKDVATARSLLEYGADVSTVDSNGATPLDLTIDDSCRELLKHHIGIYATVSADPGTLVSTVLAHCATLSNPEESAPLLKLPLREFHLEPSFL